MGMGYDFICKKCGHWYNIHLGSGTMFYKVYQSCIRDIQAGKYGEEWKALALSHEHIAVDAETYLYICESCGNWKTDMDLSLYEPKEPDKIQNEKYFMLWKLEKYCSLLKPYVHKCDKCGEIMHKFNEEQVSSLSCPKCGTENEIAGVIYWD